MNWDLIAIKLSSKLKVDHSTDYIDRVGLALLGVSRLLAHPSNLFNSSVEAALCDWIATIGRQSSSLDEAKVEKLIMLLKELDCSEWNLVRKALVAGGYNGNALKDEAFSDLLTKVLDERTLPSDKTVDYSHRNFHPSVVSVSEPHYSAASYFHAVHEACKMYNNEVKRKASGSEDGQSLMLKVYGSTGNLKVNQGKTDSQRNEQDGIKFLSAGLMAAIRNPTAHENEKDWPISEEDCLDILSLISFLFRKLDSSTVIT